MQKSGPTAAAVSRRSEMGEGDRPTPVALSSAFMAERSYAGQRPGDCLVADALVRSDRALIAKALLGGMRSLGAK